MLIPNVLSRLTTKRSLSNFKSANSLNKLSCSNCPPMRATCVLIIFPLYITTIYSNYLSKLCSTCTGLPVGTGVPNTR